MSAGKGCNKEKGCCFVLYSHVILSMLKWDTDIRFIIIIFFLKEHPTSTEAGRHLLLHYNEDDDDDDCFI